MKAYDLKKEGDCGIVGMIMFIGLLVMQHEKRVIM